MRFDSLLRNVENSAIKASKVPVSCQVSSYLIIHVRFRSSYFILTVVLH